jgi:hypothetical protein
MYGLTLTEVEYKNLLVFWKRVPLTGEEATAWMEVSLRINNAKKVEVSGKEPK